MVQKRIVITGLGVVSSIGIGKDEFWKNLIKAKSGISEIDTFDASDHFTHHGGQVKGFRPEEFMCKRKVKLMGRASNLAIAASRLALEDAKLDLAKVNGSSVSVLLGTTGGESQEIEEIDDVWLKQGKDAVDLWSIMQYPVNNISSNVALELKAKGLNRIFTTACAAGNYAIGYGYDLIRLGKSDIIVAGGSDAFSYLAFTGFNQVRAVAPLLCQPFDKNRKGMIPGEGAGILILETLQSAQNRGAPIYAEILGYGLSCDAYHMTNPHVEGVTQCISDALEKSSLKPDDIDYISAHGTGTKYNDKTECAAIKNIFGDKKIAVSSIKSMLGHTMGAASAIEAISCCLVIKNSIIPPTINYDTPDSECVVDCVPNKARKQEVSIALNNGFAFGGNNACLTIKKFEN